MVMKTILLSSAACLCLFAGAVQAQAKALSLIHISEPTRPY